RLFPGPPLEHDVEVAVIVDVGPGDVQGVDLVVESGRRGAVLEGAVASVDEQGCAAVDVERGAEEVGHMVAGEVVEHASAGQVWAARGQPNAMGDVLEPAHIDL